LGTSGDSRLERVLGDIVARARRQIDPDRIWLFGSHSRGEATRASDIDLAFEVPDPQRSNWAGFVTEANDEVPALVNLDLVDLGSCQQELAREIVRTGRVVYERDR
jgi:predicted nucleotidyltransferase